MVKKIKEAELIDVNFEYINGEREDVEMTEEEFEKLQLRLQEHGFTGMWSSDEGGIMLNLAAMRSIY